MELLPNKKIYGNENTFFKISTCDAWRKLDLSTTAKKRQHTSRFNDFSSKFQPLITDQPLYQKH